MNAACMSRGTRFEVDNIGLRRNKQNKNGLRNPPQVSICLEIVPSLFFEFGDTDSRLGRPKIKL